MKRYGVTVRIPLSWLEKKPRIGDLKKFIFTTLNIPKNDWKRIITKKVEDPFSETMTFIFRSGTDIPGLPEAPTGSQFPSREHLIMYPLMEYFGVEGYYE
jgi:hypothetical protein